MARVVRLVVGRGVFAPRPTVALVLDGRVVRGVDAEDAVRTIMVREFGYEGPRAPLGPFCAWMAEQCGAPPVDPALHDAEAAEALVAGLLAVGAAGNAEAEVVPIRRP